MKPDAPSPSAGAEPITALLLQASLGDRAAMDELFPLVYDQLRRMAHASLCRERPDHTLGTTGLVHEAYLRLVDQTRASWRDRAHFYAVAALAMRRILVDYARRHRRGHEQLDRQPRVPAHRAELGSMVGRQARSRAD